MSTIAPLIADHKTYSETAAQERDTMLTAERRRRILEMLATDERVEVSGLAEHFDVSESTVRRDLRTLARSGTIERTHGGALASTILEPSFARKRTENRPQKLAVGRAAARLVEPGATVFFDAGTTTLEVARAIGSVRNLTVVTTSLAIALEMVERATVHVVGGTLKERTMALIGPMAERSIDQMHVDLAFIGANGVAVGAGITTPTWEEASVKARMIATATTAVVVADGSKVGAVTFARVAGLEEVDLFITDDGAPAQEIQKLRSAGLRVEVAPVNPAEPRLSVAADDEVVA
jgi:DeoR family fructose operon transcriptional repressor